MPRIRKKITKDCKRKVWIGHFHELTTGSIRSNSIRRDICSFDEAAFKTTSRGKKKRTDFEIASFLTELRENKLKELQAEKQGVEKSKNRSVFIYWLFEMYVENLTAKIESGQRAQNTLDKYNYAIRYYKDSLGDHPIERRYFNDEKISRFISYMKKSGCNDRSVWNYCISIKSILNWGYDQFDENDNRYVTDLIKFPLPTKPKSKMVLYTTEEVLALENEILKEYREGYAKLQKLKKQGSLLSRHKRELLGVLLVYKAFFLIKNTAMREGETLFLPYEHINLDRGEIEIKGVDYVSRSRLNGTVALKGGHWEPKGNKVYRTVDISENKQLLDFLRWDIENKSPKEKFYMGNGQGVLFFANTPMFTRAMRKYVYRVPNIGKVKPFHSLRGWAITYLLAQGFPIAQVQDMVGHEDTKTTIGYWNLMKNASGELVGKLGVVEGTSLEKPEIFKP